MRTKISVVIPTYKRPALLNNCLQALVKQTFDKRCYEVIVVSDGPDAATEQSIREISKYTDCHLRFIHLPEKKGPAAARNMGWKSAKGILIAFTDDDTLPDSEWLSTLWKTYDAEPYVAYTGGVKVPVSEQPTDFEKNTLNLETAEFVTANCCITKKALAKTGGFDERFSMAWREDSDLHFKLLLNRIPIIKVPQALIVHPVRTAPWGGSIKEQKKGIYNALLYKKYPELYRQRIMQHKPLSYYLIVGSAMACAAGLAADMKWLAVTGLAAWGTLTLSFISKRLANTSKSWKHIAEMIVTSIAIPFLSIYWHLYGAWRYRVLFL